MLMSDKTDGGATARQCSKNTAYLMCTAIFALLAAPLVEASPAVNGSEISWPDDGWYQVQSATTYADICQGGRSCTVDDGSYIVINHTTGERFEDIEVMGSDSGGGSSQVTVDGGTISWPDDGWYQVQSADTFESLCEGGSGCAVPAGVYIVINHMTGTRYTGITVEGDDSIEPNPGTGLALDTLSNDLIYELAGNQLEQNATFAPDLAADVVANNSGLVSLDAGQFVIDDRGSVIVQPTERTQYACAEGEP